MGHFGSIFVEYWHFYWQLLFHDNEILTVILFKHSHLLAKRISYSRTEYDIRNDSESFKDSKYDKIMNMHTR